MFGSTLRESLQGVFQDERDPLEVDQKESMCASLYFELIEQIKENQPEDCIEVEAESFSAVAGECVSRKGWPRDIVIARFIEEIGSATIEGGIMFIAYGINGRKTKTLITAGVSKGEESTWVVFRRDEGEENMRQLRGKRRLQNDFRKRHYNWSNVGFSRPLTDEKLQEYLHEVDIDRAQVKEIIFEQDT